MSSKLVTWVDEEIEFFGQTVKVRLKLPPFGKAPALIKRIEAMRLAGDPALLFEPEALAWVEEVFARWVRLPEPLEADGVEIDSGPALLEVASLGLVGRILGRLVTLAYLAEHEGKASASPSTPSVETEKGSGGSSFPAPSTGGEAGPTP